jgi:uncharacterized protein (TIGR00375 family)
MKIIADLHIHGRFSRATSTQLTIPNLVKYARIKGIGLLGTGDCLHPIWLSELKSQLTEDGTGILKDKDGFGFVLSAEISSIYSQGGKARRVHNIILLKNFEVADQVIEALEKRKVNLKSDGRPICGIPCPELVELIMGVDREAEVIPAHVWTPWFSVFGSESGFDTIEECFKDQAKNIHALETGLSSDPAMNWRLSSLDKYALLSFSDSHSFWPWRIGREATAFDVNMDYNRIINAIRTKSGLVKTVEFFPEEGKYHYDGHRACKISLSPEESRRLGNVCPVCRRPLTIGVLNRVEQLADRPEGFVPRGAIPFKSLIPLTEIISSRIGVEQLYSKRIWTVYNQLIQRFGSEFAVLLDAGEQEMAKAVGSEMAKAIVDVREGKVEIRPGYDGVYGYPVFGNQDKDRLRERVERKAEKEGAAKAGRKSSQKKSGSSMPEGHISTIQRSLAEF